MQLLLSLLFATCKYNCDYKFNLEVHDLIGDNIKFYRKKNQLTQDDIAKECSVTRQAVSKWENGV